MEEHESERNVQDRDRQCSGSGGCQPRGFDLNGLMACNRQGDEKRHQDCFWDRWQRVASAPDFVGEVGSRRWPWSFRDVSHKDGQ